MPNLCALLGIILATCAVVCIVFSEVAQLGNSLIPRHLRIAWIDTSAMTTAGNGLYYSGTSDYLGIRSSTVAVGDGLRKQYEWGFWGYCATNEGLGGPKSYCVREGFGATFRPTMALVNDAPTAYKAALESRLPTGTFAADGYLWQYSQAANYTGFIGAVLTVIALLFSVIPKRLTYLFGALFALVGSLAFIVSLSIYTAIFIKTREAVQAAKVGMTMNLGNGLWILWAGLILVVLAIVPYFMACCIGNVGEEKYREEEFKDHHV